MTPTWVYVGLDELWAIRDALREGPSRRRREVLLAREARLVRELDRAGWL